MSGIICGAKSRRLDYLNALQSEKAGIAGKDAACEVGPDHRKSVEQSI